MERVSELCLGMFGGGRGAAIGALGGGTGGLFTQFVTRGRVVKVPAETVLVFRLNRQLVLQSGGSPNEHSGKEKKRQSYERDDWGETEREKTSLADLPPLLR